MGTALMLSPFFFAGHIYCLLAGLPQDGYSMPYQNAMSIGVLIYLFAGLFFLRKVLLNYFSDKATALTLLIIVLGTTLLWYSTFECFMNHAITFSLICICMFYFFNWIDYEINRHLLLFALCFGLVVLIRPLACAFMVFFAVYGVAAKGGTIMFLHFLSKNFTAVCLAVLIAVIIFFPQLFYWKYVTGNWYYDTYSDEHFIFNDPMFFSFLISFRKGWLIYTPLMWLALAGFIVLYKKYKALFYSSIITLVLTIYIYSSWWAWSYGISWGLRPMLDIYGILSIPITAFIDRFFSASKIVISSALVVICLFILFNLFQTWQYKNGLIHYDDNTFRSYFEGLVQTKATWQWQDALQPYDFERRKKGLPQIIYTADFIAGIKQDDFICLRGFNFKLASAPDWAHGLVICTGNQIDAAEVFNLVRLNGDTVAVKTSAGKYVSVIEQVHYALFAMKDSAGAKEKFILVYHDENKISLKAYNNKFVAVISQWKNALCAVSDSANRQSTFRMYLLEKK